MRMTLFAIACLAASPALAQQGSGQLPKGEQIFLDDAASIGRAEMRLGQLALEKSDTPRIRQLGQTMLDDHRTARDRLQLIAASERLRLPPEPTPAQQATYRQLAALAGADFDRAYLDQLKSDQLETLALYREEAQNGRDPQLRAFAQEMLPVVQRHAQMVGLPAR
jgi:putative membrane protein